MLKKKLNSNLKMNYMILYFFLESIFLNYKLNYDQTMKYLISKMKMKLTPIKIILFVLQNPEMNSPIPFSCSFYSPRVLYQLPSSLLQVHACKLYTLLFSPGYFFRKKQLI